MPSAPILLKILKMLKYLQVVSLLNEESNPSATLHFPSADAVICKLSAQTVYDSMLALLSEA